MFEPNLPLNRFPNACPCCGYATLDVRGEYDICAICWWEDDGQDNSDANIVRGGPNGTLSLTRARINFLVTGIFEQSRTDLRDQQQSCASFVQERQFVFDESLATVSEPAFDWNTTIRELDDDKSQSLYRIGDQVSVVLNYRNKTPRSGTINCAIWHHKLGIWHYRIVDELGHRVSKRYAAPDLTGTSETIG